MPLNSKFVYYKSRFTCLYYCTFEQRKKWNLNKRNCRKMKIFTLARRWKQMQTLLKACKEWEENWSDLRKNKRDRMEQWGWDSGVRHTEIYLIGASNGSHEGKLAIAHMLLRVTLRWENFDGGAVDTKVRALSLISGVFWYKKLFLLPWKLSFSLSLTCFEFAGPQTNSIY